MGIFNFKEENIRRVISTNYGLILLELAIGLFLVLKYSAFPLSFMIGFGIAVLATNLVVHLTVHNEAGPYVRDFAAFLLAFVIIVGLTGLIHYNPDIRPALLWAYVPAIIFSSTMSLSYGLMSTFLIILSFLGLLVTETLAVFPYANDPLNYFAQPSQWKLSISFVFIFLMILAFLANFFMETLRRRQAEIAKLAEANKKLYQSAKTTSDEIFRNMKEGMAVFDGDFKIVQYNAAFGFLAKASADLTGASVDSLNDPMLKQAGENLKFLAKNSQDQINFELKDNSGNPYEFNLSEFNLKENEPGYIAIINPRPLPWGVVFDSITNRPLGLAIVRLFNLETSKVIETKATDLDGRFGFIVEKGKYKVEVAKEDYIFPSEKTTEGYHGEEIRIDSPEGSDLSLKIPLDPKETKAPD